MENKIQEKYLANTNRIRNIKDNEKEADVLTKEVNYFNNHRIKGINTENRTINPEHLSGQ